MYVLFFSTIMFNAGIFYFFLGGTSAVRCYSTFTLSLFFSFFLFILRFFLIFIWFGLFCCVFVPGTLALRLTCLDELRLLGLPCFTVVCGDRICIYISTRMNQHGLWVF